MSVPKAWELRSDRKVTMLSGEEFALHKLCRDKFHAH
jgi:hypothetical protein